MRSNSLNFAIETTRVPVTEKRHQSKTNHTPDPLKVRTHMAIKITSIKDLCGFLRRLPGDLSKIRYFNRHNQWDYDVVFDPPLRGDSCNTLRLSLGVIAPDDESQVPCVRWEMDAVHFGLRSRHLYDGSAEIARFDEGTLTLVGDLVVGKGI